MIMLESKSLNVGYGKKIVVNDVNIQVKKGEILCLLGANGAGKTTILRSLSGLLPKLNGDLYLKDRRLESVGKKDLAKEVALVLTARFNADLMRVYDVVAMGRYPHTGFFGRLTEKDKKKIEEALELVSGTKLIHRFFDELSDGEKQKVLVARALVQEPELIILDEPTTHLDIKHRLELMEILKFLAKEKNIAVIISLHEIDIALKSCHKVMLIKDNKVLAYGEPEEVVDEEVINGLYGLKERNFNNLLGAVEISNFTKEKVFVVGGQGKGIPIYRALGKRNIGVCTGIIHENDVDYEIARTMGIGICSSKAFNVITDEEMKKAMKVLDKCNVIIDTDCIIGDINRKNLELVNYALKNNKKVFSLRTEAQGDNLYKDLQKEITYVNNVRNIIDNLN